jgi:hypothetical protein
VTAGVGPERVTVVVNPGCHLCEDAVAVVALVCGDIGVGWRSVELADVDDSRRTEWREMVPVVLVDGAVFDIFRVDGIQLRAALTGSG